MNNTCGTWKSRGYIPHFNSPGALQIITTRLYDSLPEALIRRIYETVPAHQGTLRKQYIEQNLDRGFGDCWLRQPELATIVQDALIHFDQERFRLLAWVIMPNHVHLLIETFPSFPVSKLMSSLKSFTAKEINRRLNRTGHVWQREYFDRMVRDADHYRTAVGYIHMNPVKAKLVREPQQWRFSSAADAAMMARQQEPLGDCRRDDGAPG